MKKDFFQRLIRNRINEHIEIMKELLANPKFKSEIASVADLIIHAYTEDKKVILFGNGGSAADAQHIATELVGKYTIERKALAAEAITVNSSLLTAIANDYAYNHVFARQIEAIGIPGDVAIGLSTSGKSVNIIEGIRVAKKKGLTTVGLTGKSGGKLINEVDYCICVPSEETPRIQEVHILIGHIVCELVEEVLFGREGQR